MPFDGSELSSQLLLDLIAARHYLDEHGWCKGTLSDGERRCLIGAIREVTGVLGLPKLKKISPEYIRSKRAEQIVEHMIYRVSGHKSIFSFNDAPYQTYANIRFVLDKTIKDVEERELDHAV